MIDAKTVSLPPVINPVAKSLVPGGFVPLALKAPPKDGDIRIELHRAGTRVNIVWPAAAAAEYAAGLRDWLR